MAAHVQYAPTYRLTINGNELPDTVRSCVTAVRYEDGREGADQVQISLVNPNLRFLQSHIRGLSAFALPTGVSLNTIGRVDAALVPVVDFFTYPKFGDVRPTTEVFAENTLMIHARSQHLHEAAEFVNYYVSTEVQTKYVQDVNPFPANINVDISGLTPLMARVGKAMAEAGFYTYMHVDHGFDPAIADTFLNSLQAVLGDAMTPEEAAQATESEAVSVRGEVQQ